MAWNQEGSTEGIAEKQMELLAFVLRYGRTGLKDALSCDMGFLIDLGEQLNKIVEQENKAKSG